MAELHQVLRPILLLLEAQALVAGPASLATQAMVEMVAFMEGPVVVVAQDWTMSATLAQAATALQES